MKERNGKARRESRRKGEVRIFVKAKQQKRKRLLASIEILAESLTEYGGKKEIRIDKC